MTLQFTNYLPQHPYYEVQDTGYYITEIHTKCNLVYSNIVQTLYWKVRKRTCKTHSKITEYVRNKIRVCETQTKIIENV